MKSTLVLLQSAALVAGAIAQDAFLWTIDAGVVKHTSHQTSTISSDTASSIIARRRGITELRYLRTSDEAVLSDINTYGGYQKPLFGADMSSTPEKIMIRINGFNGSVSQFTSLPDLWIESPTTDLADDFGAGKVYKNVCAYNLSPPTKKGVDIIYSYDPEGASCKSVPEVEKLPAILTAYSATPVANDVERDLSSLLRIMSHLAATGNVESTVLVLPSPSALRKPKSRRAAQTEEPLDLPSSDSVDIFDEPETPQQTNSSHPLPKVIPQCFKSETTCNNVTNSCSGHGSCYQAHPNCFKCRCGTTVLQRDAGKKTIQWGGNACQKKDISMPFALFATYGIVMSAVVAGGIGMLYSMGAQDLPSVLGAGVAGPKAQK